MHQELLIHKLHTIGFTDIDSVSTYLEASIYIDENKPDIALIDYFLDKPHTGVDFVKEFLLNRNIPVIFITGYYGMDVFEEILPYMPMDFLSKGDSEFVLEKSISLALIRKQKNAEDTKVKDFLFVRTGKGIKKLAIREIEYITIDGKYLELFMQGKKFLIRSTMADFFEKLPDFFIRIHQSYIINLNYLESINVEEGTVDIKDYSLPFSRNYKRDLFNLYYMP